MAIAILIGSVCSIIIWVLHPLNNFVLNNSFIADSYLPELGVAMIAVLVLGINPLLRRKAPARALTTRQLAVIFAMILVACVPVQMLRAYPHALAHSNADIARNRGLADAHKEMALPKALYLEPFEFNAEMPASTQMIDELDPGSEIPWGLWLGPTLAWGSMIAACWLIMFGIALALFPQWRDNERLAFPLLAVQQALIEPPEKGGLFPAIFRSGWLWAGVIVVMLIYAFNGLSHHTGDAFPPFGISWNLTSVFWGTIGRHLDWSAKTGRLYFAIVGVAYFLPGRVSFSLWGTYLAYQLYRMIGYEYMAPFHAATIEDHQRGAMLGVALTTVWLGRRQWLRVFRAVFRPPRTGADRRDRTAGRIFVVGCVALLGWHLWAGNALHWAVFSVVMVFVSSLVLARLVAETGLPFVAMYASVGYFMSLMPMRWLSAKAIHLCGGVDILISGVSRVSASVAGMYGLGIDKDVKPSGQARLMRIFIVTAVAGMLVAGAVHVWMGYSYPGSLDGLQTPISRWGSGEMVRFMNNPLKSFVRGSWPDRPYNQLGHLVFGFLSGVALHIGCLLSPLWPLHPVGMLLANNWFLRIMWPSIILGWALRKTIISYGGARAYRVAKPLFLGLVLGEVFSAVLWAVVPLVLLATGGDAAQVGHIQVLPP